MPSGGFFDVTLWDVGASQIFLNILFTGKHMHGRVRYPLVDGVPDQVRILLGKHNLNLTRPWPARLTMMTKFSSALHHFDHYSILSVCPNDCPKIWHRFDIHIKLHSQDSCFSPKKPPSLHQKQPQGACQTARQWEFCFIFFEALGSQRVEGVVDLVPWSWF